ncbi:MAG: cytochrome c [bacterium]|nr:cytochrome c [bacterium]
MKIKVKLIFALLCVAFVIYSLSIYLVPIRKHLNSAPNATLASKGRLVWQDYNCESCHQLYGLGGYMGPDLTNIYSCKGKGPIYIKALVKSGTGLMPPFHLTEEEETNLLHFLRSTDESGSADPRNFTINALGMIEKK